MGSVRVASSMFATTPYPRGLPPTSPCLGGLPLSRPTAEALPPQKTLRFIFGPSAPKIPKEESGRHAQSLPGTIRAGPMVGRIHFRSTMLPSTKSKKPFIWILSKKAARKQAASTQVLISLANRETNLTHQVAHHHYAQNCHSHHASTHLSLNHLCHRFTGFKNKGSKRDPDPQ